MTTMPRQKPGLSDQDLETPDDLIEAVKRLLFIDAFEVDLAATGDNTKGGQYISPATDSLLTPWNFSGWNWLNPPFGKIGPWAEKCSIWRHRTRIALLVPAAVGSNWWRDYVQPYAAVHHLNGRPSFDGKAPYPKDLSLCLYGPGFLPASRSWDWRHQS